MDVLRILLKQSELNINSITREGSALHYAAKKNRKNFIDVLLENKADYTVLDHDGKDFLYYCPNEEMKNHFRLLFTKDKTSSSRGILNPDL